MERYIEYAKKSQFLLVGSVLWLVLSYCVLFFPFAFFRHDDWLNLGNAILRLPGNWSLLFSTKWIDRGVEHVWFFRPFFRLSYYLGFKAFGFSYYPWLLSTLFLTLASLALGYQIVLLLTQARSAAVFFVVFFIANFQFHLGSLLWVGEGFMNVPSMFLLSLSTYSFCRYIRENKIGWQILSLSVFILALGFKEANFANGVLLASLYFYEKKKFEWLPKALLPHIIVTISYLVFRLLFLPVNGQYQPHLQLLATNLALFGVSLGVPLVSLVLWQGRGWSRVFQLSDPSVSFFWLFFVLLILPHQGHEFFSPGWLFYPGFVLAFYLALSIRTPETLVLNSKTWAFISAVTCALVCGKMVSVDWWSWGKAQREMHAIFKSIPPEKNEVVRIRNCSPSYVHPSRVLGYAGALSDWYEAIHGKQLNIGEVPCKTPTSLDRTVLWYDWKFPHLTEAKE